MSDPLIAAAWFLDSQLEWLRHAVDEQGQPYAVAAFAEIAHCAGRLRGLVNGPHEQRFAGLCGAKVTWDDHDNEIPRDKPCDGVVFATLGAEKGTCRTCGARWAAADRRKWLEAEVRTHAFTAAQIAEAYGINVKTIRSWATDRPESRDHRGALTRSATPARLRIHAVDRHDQPLFLVGDVLDLAAADALRRHEAQAKRARRTAARESKDAA
jgi:hypothetical protein